MGLGLSIWIVLSLLSACALSAAMVFEIDGPLVCLGDSWSDSGASANMSFAVNLRKSYPGVLFPQSPYLDGRWSNGPTYIEVAARKLNKTLWNYGVGSATTGAVDVEGFGHITFAKGVLGPYQATVKLPSLLDQVRQHIQSGVQNQHSLFVIFSGSNDLAGITLGLSKARPVDMVDAHRVAIEQLYRAGARSFAIANQPATDCCLADAYIGKNKLVYDLLTDEFNSGLTLLGSQLPVSYPDATFYHFDARGAWEAARTAQHLGIRINEIACYPSPTDGFANATECQEPELYFHWDMDHPTAHANRIIADHFLADIQKPAKWKTEHLLQQQNLTQ